MIARISGLLIHKSINYLIVDICGIGYRIFVPLTTFYELPDEGQKVTLHIHTHVKEDAINLFGFHNDAEKALFQLMIGVSGIGPKLALNILSGISAEDFIRAVSTEDLNKLIRIPGVGKKTAERMVLELRDKVKKLDLYAQVDRSVSVAGDDATQEDAFSALVNLGYKSQAARIALDQVVNESPEPLNLEVLLKRTLKILAV
jgi:Holliday junction DNA helicase RuvA